VGGVTGAGWNEEKKRKIQGQQIKHHRGIIRVTEAQDHTGSITWEHLPGKKMKRMEDKMFKIWCKVTQFGNQTTREGVGEGDKDKKKMRSCLEKTLPFYKTGTARVEERQSQKTV